MAWHGRIAPTYGTYRPGTGTDRPRTRPAPAAPAWEPPPIDERITIIEPAPGVFLMNEPQPLPKRAAGLIGLFPGLPRYDANANANAKADANNDAEATAGSMSTVALSVGLALVAMMASKKDQ